MRLNNSINLADRLRSGSIRPGLFCLALAALLPSTTHACGPDFPQELLTNRVATLGQLPEGAFNFEARNLIASPKQPWIVIERADWLYNDQKVTRESVERAWWGDAYERVNALRSSASPAAAFAAGEKLPEEVRRYMAGAVAIAKHDFAEAARRFNGVLELPAGERMHYGLWAQYMLGRIAAARDENAAAVAAFIAVRAQATGPSDDPLGLAATSLGDQARVHLSAGDDTAAVALYAQQAALGSVYGRDSLLQVARAVTKDPARLDRLISDPLGQRLIASYLFTRSDELNDAPADGQSMPAGVAKAQSAGSQRIEAFLAAIERKGIDNAAGIDRFAALAYGNGKYDLAAKFAARSDSGLASWVRAKLALRNGDAAAAAQAYAQAAKAFPADEQWGSDTMLEVGAFDAIKPHCRVEGERGTLALSRGEYATAMEHLYNAASEYWPDAAYVAERVLTVDELKTFVETHVAKVAAKPAENGGYGIPVAPSALRNLLGRRLLRADRYDEALGYFDDAELKKKAQAYVDARRSAVSGDRVEQAKSWYAAAKSARVNGIDLIGYELDPDYQLYDGNFDLGGVNAGADAVASVVNADAAPAATPALRQDIVVPKQLAGADEASRVAATRASPLQRFHYRYVAVDFAQKSADLLPPRTQAFAAVLCHATSWLIDRDAPVADKLYARYIKQGPHVAWGADFGRSCPEPDFAGAAQRVRAQRIAWWKHTIRHSAPYAAIGTGLLLIGFVLWRRQRRAAKREI
jgi:hypothetical protein